ncbi:MAG: hypothetical protein H0U49_05210 [Parachlamydiaceae bacterium]|nr:hypothetical protein [Parachlamydiaceae bacterium]
MNSLKKHLAIFNLSARQAICNYQLLVGLSIFLVTCLVIFANLWKLVATKTGMQTYEPSQLLWYIALNEWVIVSLPRTHENIEQDLRSGKLAYLLSRPISYLGSLFSEACGTLFVNLSFLGAVTFIFTWFATASLPFGLEGFFLAIILAVLAGIVGIIFNILLGLSAFWLGEVDPLYWVWEKLLFMFGGLILPLTIYPIWMQTFASYTPFAAILGARSAQALDYSPSISMFLAAILLAWAAIGVLAINIVYRRGLRILTIEGG